MRSRSAHRSAVSRVEIGEVRALWANHVQGPVGDPNHDVEVSLDGIDWFAPSAVAGVLVAPPDTRVELAASSRGPSDVHVAGDVTASRWADDAMMAPGVTVQSAAGTANLDVRQPITVRTGVRWLAERWIAEVGGDLWIFPRSAEDDERGASMASASSMRATSRPTSRACRRGCRRARTARCVAHSTSS